MLRGYGRRKMESHEKSMSSYELHAWRDAMAIAELLDETVGIAKARKIYETIASDALMQYEADVANSIADFIKRTETQRPAVVRKLKDETTVVGFLTLAIIGCLRVKSLIQLRDAYRNALAPGLGNRLTTSALYSFGNEVVAQSINYDWPSEPIDAMGLDDEALF